MAIEVDVSILIPNWNGKLWLQKCLPAIKGLVHTSYRIIVVDNGSTDGSVNYLKEHHPSVEIVELPTNEGFAAAMNEGLANIQTPFVALLNNDTEVTPSWLTILQNRLQGLSEEVVAVGALMCSLEDRDTIDDAGNVLSWYGSASKRGHGIQCDEFVFHEKVFSVSAGASLFRSSFLKEIGGFYAPFFAYLEDVDLGFQALHRGYRMQFEPNAVVYHHGQGSDLVRTLYVQLITCNRLILFALNVPTKLLIKHIPQLLYGQLYFVIAYGKPFASLRGYLRFMKLLPEVLRERKTRLNERSITKKELDDAISMNKPTPPLSYFLKGYVRSIGKLLGIKRQS